MGDGRKGSTSSTKSKSNQRPTKSCGSSSGSRDDSKSYDTTDSLGGGPFSGPFDIQKLNLHLKNCIQSTTSSEDSQIPLDEYIFAFQQIYKFFCLLGTVFSYVGSDVKKKLELLASFRAESNPNRSDYVTIEGMLLYEKNSDYITTHKEKSGSRTLQPLHRALNFLSIFLDNVGPLDPAEGTYKVCKEAYSKSLSKFHPWLVQKGAMFAMLALPTKKELLSRVCLASVGAEGGGRMEPTEVKALIVEIISSSKLIYEKCEKAYEKNQLQDLC